ncbi:MAG: M4 family metallopeptidase [Hymenobacteraceae bacterium]|nr:M4 family metallopeptidase [Hymenobacteraceae bacterium]MDX5395920.1 M4 family metallopeptidase [Hymenobacteraceae bacterium]MDX5511978.1 M4 family metallopeptidase [Hymenobacteraceae bacterium]
MIKKYIVAAMAAVALSPAAMGQVLTGDHATQKLKEAEMVKIDQDSHLPDFVRFAPSVHIGAQDFVPWLKKALNLPAATDFRLVATSKDDIGYEHLKYQQYHHNYPVEGHIVMAHIRNGRVESWNGEVAPLANAAPAVSLNRQDALQQALAHVNARQYMWDIPQEEQMLKVIKNNPLATYRPHGELVFAPASGNFQQEDYVTAYKFDIYSKEPLQRVHVYVNAATGQEMFRLNRLYHADSTGTAHTRYSGTKTIKTEFTSGSYRLQQTGRGGGIRTMNLNRGTDYFAATDFTDSDNIWNNRNSLHDDVATDAHWGSEATYDYYMSRHNRNSFDNQGATMWSFIHFATGYNNAFWNGAVMTYGDGDDFFMTPLTSLDVVGHEFTHGVTDFSADLVYRYESGALNESFSDIFGAAIDFEYNASGANYLIGESIMKGGGAFRSMQNPNLYGDPDTYQGINWKTGPADNGGVHSNSGVQNFWFYLLVEGGTGTNDHGNDYDVTGIGHEKAERIAYRNLTTKLGPLSNYSDAAAMAAVSAQELFGNCSPELASTKNAWYAVGVGSPAGIKASFEANHVYACTAPATITFANKSYNATSYSWDFGDGNTSTTQTPTHTYTQPGTYSVTLRITGNGTCGAGADTVVKAGYIQVVSAGGPAAMACQATASTPFAGMGVKKVTFNTIRNSSNDATEGYKDFSCNYITTLVAGNAYDLTLETGPPPAQRARAYIDYNNDGVFDPATELVYDFNQFVISATGIVRTPVNAVLNTPLRMRIISDMYINSNISPCGNLMRGQAEDYAVQFIANTSAPVAKFRASKIQINQGESITFNDMSDFVPTSWEWRFPNGTPATSTLQNPVVQYSTPGLHDAVLIVRNSFGTDTLFKPGYVEVLAPTSVKTTLQAAAANVQVYPNPAHDKVQISFTTESSKEITLRLLNVVGQEVFSNKVQVVGKFKTAIHTQALPAGLYFVTVDDGTVPVVKKLVVEKR